MDVTTDAIAHAIDGLHAIENTIRLKLLEQILDYDTREAWREDGARSMADWLTFRHGYAPTFSMELVRVAHALPALPSIKAAHGDGRLSWDKLSLVTSVATPENDALWAEEATWLSVATIRQWVRHHRRVQREDAERQLAERYLRRRRDADGESVRIYARLPAAEAAIVDAALDRISEQAPRNADGTCPPLDWRLADALVELSSTRLAADADADRATVVVHVEARDLNRIHGNAVLEEGPSIVSETARRLACDGRVQLSVDGPDGTPIGVGRTTRTVPPWLARAIKRRDGGCRFADCGATRGVHAHHIRHWAHGGPTDADNLVLLCRFHHRLVHEGGWRLIKDSSDRLRFVRPDGRPISDRPTPLRPEVHARMFGAARDGPG